ncbi:MAG: hypothetical protein KC422_03705 [Trueperaceae bacterium]|nr:hypothetical protein [Trueperaceae bacterium]
MLTELLTAVHATPHMMVMNFAGAGAEALAWLHSVGGSSRTILEATDRYVQTSFIEATGFEPESYTSVAAAKALAHHAFTRARYLAREDKPVFGLGCTATIATDRQKRGDHRVAIAVEDALGYSTYELVITKGARDRAGEESLVSWLILYAVAEACGVFDLPELPLVKGEQVLMVFEPAAELERLSKAELEFVVLEPEGRLSTTVPENLAILSGSFNPLHDGHRQLAEVAAQQLGEDAYFELSLTNADKAPIDLAVARKRAVQFLGLDHLILSRAPLFNDKARLFKGTTFIIGADTASRLINPKYYQSKPEAFHAAFEALRQDGASFLVAGRSRQGDFQTLDDIAIPPDFRDLFSEVPKNSFHMDISSTELRNKFAKE